MNDSLETLLEKMRVLEKDILSELQKKEQEFFYEVSLGKIRFTEEARARHKLLVKKFTAYIRDSHFLILLTIPVIWALIIPVVLLDLFMSVYQAICFPVYGIPKVKRGDYFRLDRRHLAYLNWVEKLNCEYCSYANGLFAYATEIGARTEQYWCPIKHAQRVKSLHSRYHYFFDYGDAERYRQQVETVRRSFADLKADHPKET